MHAVGSVAGPSTPPNRATSPGAQYAFSPVGDGAPPSVKCVAPPSHPCALEAIWYAPMSHVPAPGRTFPLMSAAYAAPWLLPLNTVGAPHASPLSTNAAIHRPICAGVIPPSLDAPKLVMFCTFTPSPYTDRTFDSPGAGPEFVVNVPATACPMDRLPRAPLYPAATASSCVW